MKELQLDAAFAGGDVGNGLAAITAMGVQKLEELIAYRAARAFKLAVYALGSKSAGTQKDDQFRHQLFDAAASVEINIAEGFRRFSAGEFCQFLRYSRASLEEAQRWLEDGVARGYFTRADLEPIGPLAESSSRLSTALWRSLQPFVKKNR